jgi:hypothetical protein
MLAGHSCTGDVTEATDGRQMATDIVDVGLDAKDRSKPSRVSDVPLPALVAQGIERRTPNLDVIGSHPHSYARRIDHRRRRAANQRRCAILQSLRGQSEDCESCDGRDSARVGSGQS